MNEINQAAKGKRQRLKSSSVAKQSLLPTSPLRLRQYGVYWLPRTVSNRGTAPSLIWQARSHSERESCFAPRSHRTNIQTKGQGIRTSQASLVGRCDGSSNLHLGSEFTEWNSRHNAWENRRADLSALRKNDPFVWWILYSIRSRPEVGGRGEVLISDCRMKSGTKENPLLYGPVNRIVAVAEPPRRA